MVIMEGTNKSNECNIDLKTEDLRRLSKEDFLALVKKLKESTKNFAEFEQIISEKSQVLLIVRCLTGMQRKEFANVIGIHEEILRQVEVGKREIKRENKIKEISNNLKEIFSKISEINFEKALELFKEVAILTDNEKVEKVRSELEEMNLPEDLRKMNEEQFLKVFEWLREKTNNFKVFPEEMFLAKNQLILILRCALGMTRPSFARKVGINQQTLRFVEMNRKENRIRTLGVAQRWCERINNFLKTQEFSLDVGKSLAIWREINLHQIEENKEEIEKIRNEMKGLGLLDWDRTDSRLLPVFFNFFREKTNNFNTLPLSLFLADSSLSIFFMRCLTGIKQKELAKSIGCTKDLIRHLENKHEKIVHAGPALRWIHKLQALLPKDISFEDFERNWKKIMFFKAENVEKKESFKNLPREEIMKKIEELKEKTNNFTNIEKALEEDGRNIFLFRVICRVRLKELAKILKVDRKEIMDWENGKRRIGPETLERITNTFKKLLSESNLNEEKLKKNLKDIKKSKSCFKRNVLVKNGISLAEKLPPTALEEKIISFLVANKIPFKLHATLECNGKLFNVDFAIPDANNPKIIIEAFSIQKNTRNFKLKSLVIDHRFLLFKMKKPKLKTIMIGEINNFTEETKEEVIKEIIGADLTIIGDEEEVNELIKRELLNFIKINFQ
jgi:DNA-binding XRE family transcriptional regulator